MTRITKTPGASPGNARRYTVIFDGNCAVCTRLAGSLEKWDREGQLDIRPAQAPEVPDRFPWIPQQAYAESMQLIGPDGQTWAGSAAVEELLRILPRGRLVRWMFALPFGRAVADRAYRWFARNRYRLGCNDHCTPRQG